VLKGVGGSGRRFDEEKKLLRENKIGQFRDSNSGPLYKQVSVLPLRHVVRLNILEFL
jgi:hypothetical protein